MRYPTTITVMPVSVTTTYANPNFIQNIHKHRSGDYSPSAQPVSDKYRSKPESKDKAMNKTLITKQPVKQLHEKKLWNNKYPKTVSNNLATYLERRNLEDSQQRTEYMTDDNLTNNVSQEAPAAQKFLRRNQNPLQTTQARYQTHSSQPRSSTPHVQQSQLHKSAFINSPQTHTLFIGQVPQLRTTSVIQPPQTTAQKTTKVPTVSVKPVVKTTKQIASPKAIIHKLAPEKPNAEKDIQQFLGKKSLESNIQNVIDMIEGKIVDIVSSPDQTHSETFDNVEKQIVEILQTIKSDQNKPLDCIEEQDLSDKKSVTSCSDKTKKQDDEKKRRKSKKIKCHAKTTSNLNQPATLLRDDKLHSETFPHLVQKRNENLITDTSHSTISQDASSNEEHFEVTSSCFPSKIKTPVKNDRSRNKSELVTFKDKEYDMQISKKHEEIRSDQFLTPFMRTLKKYRQHDPPLNVLEFLDTLTNISDDASLKITNGCRTILHYRHKIHIAHVFYESEAFYPIAVYHTIVKFDKDMKTLESGFLSKITMCPKIVTEEINFARKLFSYINLSKFLGYGNIPVAIKGNHPGTSKMLCCHMDQLFLGNEATLQKNPLSTLGQLNQPQKEEAIQQCSSIQTATNDQHSTFLNSIYGMLFTAIFLSLTFNYTCQ
ncbi:hypothetical protein ILUMI_20731 [Ignelater luminosus]|uniref:Uncharacterized protein n=1 Tax=Ignelater luminosus TaxID=2038154 RepID=A0A8K0G4B0_IGNLU|nr:hypothetical protein ILUMI_20731 [Ignelater luminosus]